MKRRACHFSGRPGSGHAARGSLSVVLLVVVLACALVRPWGWPEAVVAVPAAVVVVGTGAISLDQARAEAKLLGTVIGHVVEPRRRNARRLR